MAFREAFDHYLADFAVDCVIDGVPALGIFDNGYQLSSPMGSAGMAGSDPTLTLPTASVPANPVGKRVSALDGADWLITEHHPDGTGVSVLLLERAL